MNFANVSYLEHRLRLLAALYSSCLTFFACAVTPRPDVINVYTQPIYNTYTDPDAKFDEYSSFTFLDVSDVKDSKMDPITEKKIQFMVRNKLEELGYEFTKDQPKSDLTIIITYSNQSETKYIPPRTIHFPIFHPSETKTGSFSYFDYGSLSSGSGSYTYEQPGYTSYVPITTGGYNVVYFYPTLLVTAYDSKTLKKKLWEGSVVCSSSEPDIRKAAQCYINLYLFNPAESLFPAKNATNLDDSGDGSFGLVLMMITSDGNDFYPYITGICTRSNCYKNGMRAGDWILSIDGKTTKNIALMAVYKMIDKNKDDKCVLTLSRAKKVFDITATAIDEQVAKKEWKEIQYIDTDGRRKFHTLE